MGNYLIPMALAQQEAGRIFSGTATVTPPTSTVNDRGGIAITYDDADAETLDCLLTEAKPSAYRQFGDGVKPGSLFTVRFINGNTIDNDSRVVIDDVTYKVAKPSSPATYGVSETYFLILE